MVQYVEIGGRIRRCLSERTHSGTAPSAVSFVAGIVLVLLGVGSLAGQPVITGVTIPDVAMKINKVVTARIFVQSDSATVYTLYASNIGGHALGSLSKQDSTTYTATFTISENGTDYAAGDDIPTSVTLADGELTNTWSTPISHANDPIDANRPSDPTPSSTSHTVSVWDNDHTIDIAISGASDAGGTGVDGFDTAWDQNETWAVTKVKDQEETWAGNTFTATANGDWYFHIATVDNAGNWTSTEHLGPFRIDNTPPSIPANLSPANGAYTHDTSPTLSWGASTDSGGSGMRDTDTYRYVVDGTPSRSGYTTNTTYTPTLTEGVYAWRVRARDNAGNNSDYVADCTLTIDVTDPADPTPSSTSHTLNIWSNDASVDIAIAGASDPLSTGTSSGVDGFDTAWDQNAAWTAAEVKEQEETWPGGTFTATSDGDWYFHIATVDNAGNWTGTEHLGPFQIDTDPPAVISVVVDTDPMFEGGLTQQVIVTFDEAMDKGTDPTITFGAGTFTSNLDGALSVGDTMWAETFTLRDKDEEIAVVTVDVTGAKDAPGNDQEAYAEQDEFMIDTHAPTVTDISARYDLITDSLTGGGSQQSFLISFSEEMDQAFDPIFSFSPDVTSPPATLTHVLGMDDWSFDGTEFEASYDTHDAESDADDVSVGVTSGKDLAGNPMQNYTPEHEFEVDTLNPTVNSVTLSTKLITDVDVGGTLTVTIDYSEDMLASTDPRIAFSPNLDIMLPFQAGNSDWTDSDTYVASYTILDGNVSVLDDDITVSATQDLVGNIQEPYNYDNQLDVDTENPHFHDLAVTGGTVDDDCLCVVTFATKVTDPNGTMEPFDITVTDATLTNGAIGTVYDLSQTSDSQTTISITGKVDVEALTGCSAVVAITLDAVDSVGNAAVPQSQSSSVIDATSPTINDLMFNTDATYTVLETDYTVDDCCEIVVYFSANVTDNCCIAAGKVDVTVTLPTGNAILEDIAVDRMQNGQKRVDVTGSAVVRCLTSCPARVEVHVEASDCCGNSAVSVTTEPTEGLVWDEVAPISRDDPRQDVVMDESAILDSLVKVGVDRNGTYRLLIRQDVPVNLNVAANDSDNCSRNSYDPNTTCSGCDAALRIYDIVDVPRYGTATIMDAERTTREDTASIRYAPAKGYAGRDQFSYRIADACGNVSGETTVYVEVVARSSMEDLSLTTCNETSVEFDVTATDPWLDPDDPGAIPFEFSIVNPPAHGVVSGDLTKMVYTAAGATTAEIASATIVLTYTPATGHVGRDTMTVQCVDSFGDSTKAVIKVRVEDCTDEEEPPPIPVEPGVTLSMILPPSFRSILEGAWGSVLLVSVEDGVAYPGVMSASWDEAAGIYVLLVDTEGLTPGEYRMMIPLGNGETVELTIEVGEAE
ncbi:Ig-like domain-containing protein [Candidatus Bipolaricaulota bacterium]